MAKMKGPYFIFKITEDGRHFTFMRGSMAKNVLEETADTIMDAYKDVYRQSATDYISCTKYFDDEENLNITTFNIINRCLPNAIKLVLATMRFGKVLVIGKDKNNVEKAVIVDSPLTVTNSNEVNPYYNKNNNDMTSKRSNR